MNHRRSHHYQSTKTTIIYLCMAVLMLISMLLPLVFSNPAV